MAAIGGRPRHPRDRDHGGGQSIFCRRRSQGYRPAAQRSARKLPDIDCRTVLCAEIAAGLLDIPQPVIAAVNGDAVGLGATLALACDVVVISDAARIGDTHVRVGLVAGDGGAVLWPLLVGPSRAKDFLMRGRLVDGAEAYRMGLVGHAVAPADVLDQAKSIAAEMAALPPLAVRWTKQSINKQIRQQLELAFDASIAFETITMLSRDYSEAVNGFLEKRKPEFKGE